MDAVPENEVADIGSLSPNIGAEFEITVFGVDGKPRQVVKQEAQCYVMNFLRMIRHWFFNSKLPGGNTVVSTNFKNLSGSIVASSGVYYSVSCSRDWYLNWGSFLANPAAGDLTKGIVAGSGSTVVTYDDYKIETIVAHGTGAGQLNYDAGAFLPLEISGNKMTIPLTRMMSNGGSSSVTVNEIALYGMGMITIMLLRDLLPSSIVLNPGESMMVVYKLILNG